MLVVVGALCVVRLIHLLAQVATLGILHEGHVARSVQRKDVALQLALACRNCRLLTLRFGESGKVRVIRQVKNEIVGLLQVILRELQGKLREFLFNFAEAFLLFIGKVCPRTLKSLVGLLKKHLLLRVQAVGTCLHHSLHTEVKSLVKHDV